MGAVVVEGVGSSGGVKIKGCFVVEESGIDVELSGIAAILRSSVDLSFVLSGGRQVSRIEMVEKDIWRKETTLLNDSKSTELLIFVLGWFCQS